MKSKKVNTNKKKHPFQFFTKDLPTNVKILRLLEVLLTIELYALVILEVVASILTNNELSKYIYFVSFFLGVKFVMTFFQGTSVTYYVVKISEAIFGGDYLEDYYDVNNVMLPCGDIVRCSIPGCIGEGEPGKYCTECGNRFVAPAAVDVVKCCTPGCPGEGKRGKFCIECGNKLN